MRLIGQILNQHVLFDNREAVQPIRFDPIIKDSAPSDTQKFPPLQRHHWFQTVFPPLHREMKDRPNLLGEFKIEIWELRSLADDIMRPKN